MVVVLDVVGDTVTSLDPADLLVLTSDGQVICCITLEGVFLACWWRRYYVVAVVVLVSGACSMLSGLADILHSPRRV